MIMMPLGPQLMRQLSITPREFGGLISSYAITAGVVGLAAAPITDRFDRRKLLLFCYAGFTFATLACGLSDNAATLLLARWSSVISRSYPSSRPIWSATSACRKRACSSSI